MLKDFGTSNLALALEWKCFMNLLKSADLYFYVIISDIYRAVGLNTCSDFIVVKHSEQFHCVKALNVSVKVLACGFSPISRLRPVY